MNDHFSNLIELEIESNLENNKKSNAYYYINTFTIIINFSIGDFLNGERMTNPIFSEENLRNIINNFEFRETPESWILKKDCLEGTCCDIIIDKQEIHDLLPFNNDFELKKFFLKKIGSWSNTRLSEHLVKVDYEHPSLRIEPYYSKTMSMNIVPLSKTFSLFLYLSNPLPDDLQAGIEFKLENEDSDVNFWEIIDYINKSLKFKSLKIKSLLPLSKNHMDKLAYATLLIVHTNIMLY